ncbi:MAG: hypothetical protein N2053_07315 [Chitinispirillaceae bacterium]|nr:hypothetical protein [Chitinispirillaceae bacterium]
MLYNFLSLIGLGLLILGGYLFSTNRKRVEWRIVIVGVGLQFLIALFIFKVPAGTKFFLFINDTVIKLIDASTAGVKFLFGPLAEPPASKNSLGFILALQSLPTIIFFSALMSLLYFVKIMPVIIKGFAKIFSKTMNISGAESLSVASNIFVGIESVFTIRPFLLNMTRSELCTVITAGMATVSSNVLALYVFTLQKQFPTIAGHLISASLLSAPAAVVMSKLLLPEEDTPETMGRAVNPYYEKDSNFFEAIINGANAGVKAIAGIAALLIAVLGLVAVVDMLLGGIGQFLNNFFKFNFDWSLKGLLGIIFYPFSFVMGVSPDDALTVAKIVGERTVATEVAGYNDLALAISNGTIKHPRSVVITTYALCGFAHVASMAIFTGGITALIPSRTKVVSRLGVRALVAATLACIMTACMAGIFFTDSAILIYR